MKKLELLLKNRWIYWWWVVSSCLVLFESVCSFEAYILDLFLRLYSFYYFYIL